MTSSFTQNRRPLNGLSDLNWLKAVHFRLPSDPLGIQRSSGEVGGLELNWTLRIVYAKNHLFHTEALYFKVRAVYFQSSSFI